MGAGQTLATERLLLGLRRKLARIAPRLREDKGETLKQQVNHADLSLFGWVEYKLSCLYRYPTNVGKNSLALRVI